MKQDKPTSFLEVPKTAKVEDEKWKNMVSSHAYEGRSFKRNQ